MKPFRFNAQLLKWYDEHRREMPWRGLLDPYPIWLSEVILQQTRVEQGLPYFNRFIALFPNVGSLAGADIDTVLKAWEGLGYYSRARNLHKAAKLVVDELEGVFPTNYSGLLTLPGVGPYTAAAIASICYNEAVPVIDGNVNRFISRLIGLEIPVDSSEGRVRIQDLLEPLIRASGSPGDFNQAVMEFGSRYCVPRNPECGQCIFEHECQARAQELVDLLPIKKSKTKVINRYFDYHVLLQEGHVFLQKRSGSGIWKGLYEFILQERDGPAHDCVSLITHEEIVPLFVSSYTHVLSHQRIFVRFLVYSINSNPPNVDLKKILFSNLESYPLARVTTRFLEENASRIHKEGI